MRGILLWLIGIPIPIIILLNLFHSSDGSVRAEARLRLRHRTARMLRPRRARPNRDVRTGRAQLGNRVASRSAVSGLPRSQGSGRFA